MVLVFKYYVESCLSMEEITLISYNCACDLTDITLVFEN